MTAKDKGNYESSIRSAARALFNESDLSMFLDTMLLAVERGLSQAWFEGMRKCGIEPEEISDKEDTARIDLMMESISRIGTFGGYILDIMEAGESFPSIEWRIALWSNRYAEAISQAQIMACTDKKLVWRLGATKEHCASCSKLEGKVKRASTWEDANIRPQHRDLECGGWLCQCFLEETDLPLSRGGLPGIP